jgi:hypothetical protein
MRKEIIETTSFHQFSEISQLSLSELISMLHLQNEELILVN